MPVEYAAIAAAVREHGFVARGAFDAIDADAPPPDLPDGRRARSIVVVGNVGGEMWPHFRAAETPGPNPLDRWTRSVLAPVADRFGAMYLHPSDEPFQPFQRWAQLADDVWPSPIGLLVHAEHGLWHAYRGAFVFADVVVGAPTAGPSGVGRRGDRPGRSPAPTGYGSPCITCVERPCLTACPVDAFSAGGYDSAACAAHVRSRTDPACLVDGCAARCACPVGRAFRYGPDQMGFHMAAFVGDGP